MTSKNIPTIGDQSFEELKQSNDHGAEFWSARDLQPLLGYTQWRRFEDAIKRAITSCEQSGNNPAHHFAGAGKPIIGGKGAARQAGVQDRMFGVFHDAGYKGLYGGLGGDAIKARKNIPAKEQLLDRMNATELAANQFRMTQTRDKLARENIGNQQQAIRTHEEVGKEVRAAIERIGGTLPEQIPPAEHIKEVEKRIKNAVPKMELGEKDAGGLLGNNKSKSKNK
ncbi:MAG: hypothetical protein Q7T29_01520 [Gallionella sp.]|nr:hypothetical protein [Gallionella sp.]